MIARQGQSHVVAMGAPSVRCPACGDKVVVRTRGYQVRCLSCQHRWQVDRSTWNGLPVTHAGLSGHTWADGLATVGYTKFPLLSRAGACVIFLLVVLPGILYLVLDQFFNPWWVWVLLLLVYSLCALLVIGRLANIQWSGQRFATHCECGYDLRYSGETCPECGRRKLKA
jgi:hypothetical protein